MLILKRRCLERVYVGPDVVVTFLNFQDGQAAIGIDAPPDIRILREELLGRYGLEGLKAQSSPLLGNIYTDYE